MKRSNISNKKRAFSIPELLIFLAIVGVISVMMLTIIKPSEKALKYQYYNAYNTLNTAAYNIRQDVIDANNSELNNTPNSPYTEEDKEFPDTAKKFCTRFAVNPNNPNYKYGYINTTDYNCNSFSALTSYSKTSFTDSKMAFRASNSMKYYISNMNTTTINCDLDKINVSIKYFLVWVDLNGDRGPNTPEWKEGRPADIVPFVVTNTGKVLPVGQPTVDRRYLQAYVDIDSTESSEYTPSTTYYQAQIEAFGNIEYPSVDLTSVLLNSKLSGLAKIQKMPSISASQREICQATEQEKEEGNFIPPCTVVVEEQKGGL